MRDGDFLLLWELSRVRRTLTALIVTCGDWRSSEDRFWSRLLSAMICNSTLHRTEYPSSIYLPRRQLDAGTVDKIMRQNRIYG
jgi:hypothetical protein